jgi:hypothetical protein
VRIFFGLRGTERHEFHLSDLNTADMLIMLPTARMNPRYCGRYARTPEMAAVAGLNAGSWGGQRRVPQRTRARGLARIGWNIGAAWLAAVARAPQSDRDARPDAIHRMVANMMRSPGVTVVCKGAMAARSQPSLLIANHVSWLDICTLTSIDGALFVAKAEVPFIGDQTFVDSVAGFSMIAKLLRRSPLVNRCRHACDPARDHARTSTRACRRSGRARKPFAPRSGGAPNDAVIQYFRRGEHLGSDRLRWRRGDASTWTSARSVRVGGGPANATRERWSWGRDQLKRGARGGGSAAPLRKPERRRP